MRPQINNAKLSNKTILVIDDDTNNLRVISDCLEENDFKVLIAQGGESGFQKAQYAIPDLILLDVLMPDMDGFTVCQNLKRNELTKNIPVVFMTALTATEKKIKGFKVGGTDFITKPFQEEEVLVRVRTQLSVCDMQQKLIENNARLIKEISEHKQTENLVKQLNEELEQRVKKRTLDLSKEIEVRKNAEKMLRESEQRYKTLATSVADGIILVQDKKLIFVNDAFTKMLGYSSENELIGKNADIFITKGFNKGYDSIKKHYDSFDLDAENSVYPTEIFQGICTSKGGREFWIEGHNSIIKWKGKYAILCTIRDINERKLDEFEHQAKTESLQKENLKLRSSIKERFRFGDIIGKSPEMQKVYELIIRAASSDANVVIYGESGTGKELVAKAIHNLSPRSDKSLVTVNCQAIPDSLLESSFFGHRKGAFTGAHADKAGFLEKANEGDLFLDEVGDIDLAMQGKLLRAIEGGGFSPVGTNETFYSDFRIIAATNKDMNELVKNGTMREDFYYRIHIIPIWLPPLRKRKEDLPLLVHHFLSTFNKDKRPHVLPANCMDAIYHFEWPGNVRELQNAIQRYLTIGNLEFLNKADNKGGIDASKDNESKGEIISEINLNERLADFEKKLILKALDNSDWNRNKTLKLLGIPRRTLYHKMKKYDLI